MECVTKHQHSKNSEHHLEHTAVFWCSPFQAINMLIQAKSQVLNKQHKCSERNANCTHSGFAPINIAFNKVIPYKPFYREWYSPLTPVFTLS